MEGLGTKHGVTAYRYGCRCAECKAARREYNNEYRKEKPRPSRTQYLPVKPLQHGGHTLASKYQCKCTACVEFLRAYQRKRKRDPNKRRKQRIERVYGLTAAALQELIDAQRGCCGICGVGIANDSQTHIDHCHVTGAVRGALCAACNKGLGHFKDSATLLAKAIEYLEPRRWRG